MGAVGNTPGVSIGVPVSWLNAPKTEVLAELQQILESHHFHSSKKCSRFLKHIVEAAISGRFDCLKERTLGVDVFGREPHYDTNQDPIVRGTAGEVRKRLAQYYQETVEGKLRFSLPAGSYVPELHSVLIEQPERKPTGHRLKPRNSGKNLRVAAISLLVGTLLGLFVWRLLKPTDLERFWAPVLAGKTVLVCMGQPHFYAFRTNTARFLESWFSDGIDGHRAPQISSISLDEVVPMWDKSVALADVQAFARLGNLFAQEQKQIELRGDRSVSLSDLRGRPAVLIGAFDNDWALSLTGELRYYFFTDKGKNAQFIRDRQHPALMDWELVDAWPPGKAINKDYALVTRVVNRTTERTVIMLGGITQYGTEAAAEFVTDPSYFARAMTHAPRDWYRKNMQVVLSTKVLSGMSGPPAVVGVYFW